MSIERSGAASSAKAVAGGESHKGKVKSGDAANTPAAGGFSALLTSLETPADPIDAAVPKVENEEQPPMVVLPAQAPATELAPNVPLELSLLLAHVGAQASQASQASQAGQAGQVAVDKLSPSSDPSRPVGVKGAVRLTVAATGADNAEIQLASPAALAADKAADVMRSVDGQFDGMVQAVPARTRKVAGADVQSGAGAILAESRALKLSSLMDVSATQSAFSGALVSSGIGDGLLRQLDRASAKSSALPPVSGAESPWGQHALLAETRVDSPTAAADPSMLSLESMVADTVSHWVTQGVQNAELTLDGLGGEPVEVSISLRGDEAHIGFRTDRPETRQVLEGAVAHLKELLAGEGLVLSGVSVGTSGQDGAGTQERRNRPGEQRQATITTTEVRPIGSPQRANHAVGRSVDIFV